MIYEIVFSAGAIKDLKIIHHKDQLKIIDKIELLKDNPFPKGCVKLKTNIESLYRIRRGNYRVLYHVDSGINIIDIRRIGHRKDIYQTDI
ncbi:MAG: type II toxin-antitoxin system RelE/ParE family toxin [Saprospiraceae bacterium]|jgi:mRNA interferase RelE/StbE|nr:type II toxin-antitoxin system RelE/ParE family toxin [Saprospiraceae bacterium]